MIFFSKLGYFILFWVIFSAVAICVMSLCEKIFKWEPRYVGLTLNNMFWMALGAALAYTPSA